MITADQHPVRELFVLTSSGLPMATLGTGDITADATLMGGLLTAIRSLGTDLGMAVDAVEFHEFRAVYAITDEAIVVLITSEEPSDFYVKARQELVDIAQELEVKGIAENFAFRQSVELEREITEIITQRSKTIFAQQNDVFLYDENHVFQFSSSSFERWNGQSLSKNYLLQSTLMDYIAIPVEDFKQLCGVLSEKRRPSEILREISGVLDAKTLEDVLRFLFMFDIIACFELKVP